MRYWRPAKRMEAKLRQEPDLPVGKPLKGMHKTVATTPSPSSSISYEDHQTKPTVSNGQLSIMAEKKSRIDNDHDTTKILKKKTVTTKASPLLPSFSPNLNTKRRHSNDTSQSSIATKKKIDQRTNDSNTSCSDDDEEKDDDDNDSQPKSKKRKKTPIGNSESSDSNGNNDKEQKRTSTKKSSTASSVNMTTKPTKSKRKGDSRSNAATPVTTSTTTKKGIGHRNKANPSPLIKSEHKGSSDEVHTSTSITAKADQIIRAKGKRSTPPPSAIPPSPSSMSVSSKAASSPTMKETKLSSTGHQSCEVDASLISSSISVPPTSVGLSMPIAAVSVGSIGEWPVLPRFTRLPVATAAHIPTKVASAMTSYLNGVIHRAEGVSMSLISPSITLPPPPSPLLAPLVHQDHPPSLPPLASLLTSTEPLDEPFAAALRSMDHSTTMMGLSPLLSSSLLSSPTLPLPSLSSKTGLMSDHHDSHRSVFAMSPLLSSTIHHHSSLCY
jgi:hypothetical protein